MLVSAPAAAQDFTISVTGNCGGTPANCGTPGNRNGDRDTTWPGLQVNEGDIIEFTVQANNVPMGATGFWLVNLATSGSAWNTNDLRLADGSPLTNAGSQLGSSRSFPTASRSHRYLAFGDGTAEPDEVIMFLYWP